MDQRPAKTSMPKWRSNRKRCSKQGDPAWCDWGSPSWGQVLMVDVIGMRPRTTNNFLIGINEADIIYLYIDTAEWLIK